MMIMKNFGNVLLLVIFVSCNSTFKKVNSKHDVIVYKNLDNTLLYAPPGLFFENDPLASDIAIKYIDKFYYKSMIDTLNKYGVKQNVYSVPRPTYVFFAKSNDTIYTTENMDEWWVIRNNKKEFIIDKNQKTLEYLLKHSKFFCCTTAP